MPLRLPLLLACFLATVLEVSCDRESLTSQLENVRAMLKRAEKNTGAAAERAVEKLRKEETVLSGNLRDWIDWEHSSGFAEEAGRQDEGLMRGRKFSCGICQVSKRVLYSTTITNKHAYPTTLHTPLLPLTLYRLPVLRLSPFVVSTSNRPASTP